MSNRRPRVAIVIPARFNSSRLPGKPLAAIMGKPMVQHVYERALQAVVVATDDDRVGAAVENFGGQWVMTSPDHPSGTDRLVEVMAKLSADIYVNLQGDEPLVRPQDIALLAEGLVADASVQVGTLCHQISKDEAASSNTVKVVLASGGDALYFSRAAIPFDRDGKGPETRYLKHVGVYAYRKEVLSTYSGLAQPMLEHAEKLEQLRLLAAGVRIRVFEVSPTGPGVDTPACLDRVRAIMAGQEPDAGPDLKSINLAITNQVQENA
jgi:3-deoxy-manno-octulosonate cytidylyltransferase (CMP-KDO synthetase)